RSVRDDSAARSGAAAPDVIAALRVVVDLDLRLEEAPLELAEDLGEMEAAATESENRSVDERDAEKRALARSRIDRQLDEIARPYFLGGEVGADLNRRSELDVELQAIGAHLVVGLDLIRDDARARRHARRDREGEAPRLARA